MVLLVKVVDKSCVPPFHYQQLPKLPLRYITSVPIGKCPDSVTSTSRQSTPQPKSAMRRLQEINSDPQTSSSTRGKHKPVLTISTLAPQVLSLLFYKPFSTH